MRVTASGRVNERAYDPAESYMVACLNAGSTATIESPAKVPPQSNSPNFPGPDPSRPTDRRCVPVES